MVPSEPGRASQEEVVLRQERRHRHVIAEPHIPFEYEVLYEDDGIIVIDKPHFLATTPRGMWYRETALIRLRERYGEPDIVPAGSVDRRCRRIRTQTGITRCLSDAVSGT